MSLEGAKALETKIPQCAPMTLLNHSHLHMVFFISSFPKNSLSLCFLISSLESFLKIPFHLIRWSSRSHSLSFLQHPQCPICGSLEEYMTAYVLNNDDLCVNCMSSDLGHMSHMQVTCKLRASYVQATCKSWRVLLNTHSHRYIQGIGDNSL